MRKSFGVLILLASLAAAHVKGVNAEEDPAPIAIDNIQAIVYAHLLGRNLTYFYDEETQVQPLFLDLESTHANYHPEKKLEKKHRSSFVMALNSEDRLGYRIKVSELKQRLNAYLNQVASSNDRYFAKSMQEEMSSDDFDFEKLYDTYQQRLYLVYDDADKRLEGRLSIWKNFIDEHRRIPIWENAEIPKRLEWMCENTLNEVATAQLKQLATALFRQDKSFCDQLAKDFIENPQKNESVLYYFLNAPFALDPRYISIPPQYFLMTPQNAALLMILLGYDLDFHDEQMSNLLGKGISRNKLELFINFALHRISLDIIYSAYYGVAPATPFETYGELLDKPAKEFLFSNIGKEADIDQRLITSDLKKHDYELLLSSIDQSVLSTREVQIRDLYASRIERFDDILKQRESNQLALQLEQKRTEYRVAFSNFAMTEACYSARKSYLVKYVQLEEVERARSKWDTVQRRLGFNSDEKEKLEKEVYDNGLISILLKSAEVSKYNQATADQCSNAYNALVLFTD